MKNVYWLSALGLLTLTFGAVALVLFGQTHYYPVVQVRFSDQTVLTFLDNPWTRLEKCEDQTSKILEKLRANCSDCQITENHCNTTLAAPRYSILSRAQSPYYLVQIGSLYVVVESPSAAKNTCLSMAEQIQNQQHKPARCLEPMP